MAKTYSTFPTSLDSNLSTDRQAGQTITSESYDVIETAISALEGKVGVNDSAVTTSLDYKTTWIKGSAGASATTLSATSLCGVGSYTSIISATNISATGISAETISAKYLCAENTVYCETGGVIKATTLCAGSVKSTLVTANNIRVSSYVSAGTLCADTICGTTVASAANIAMTYTGGNSATLSGVPGTIAICADRFLKITIVGKTYYIPAFASAGTFSAV